MVLSDVVVSLDYCVTDVWAVLSERVVERATIVVEDGLIASIVENGPTRGVPISGHGSVCIPGIIDPHSIGSPGCHTAETGVTTRFRALRFDTTDPATLDAAGRCATDCISDRDQVVVSIADPGGAWPLTAQAEAALGWFTIQAVAHRVRLIVRGPSTADDVDRAVEWGATAIEFPTTIEAARRAHERGMGVIGAAGDIVSTPTAPTAVSPLALIELGLCDALASVDRAGSLLDAVSLLVLRGVCDLRGAVRLVTAASADITGCTDRGRLASGLRGDVVLLRPDREQFTVRRVITAGIPATGRGDLAS